MAMILNNFLFAKYRRGNEVSKRFSERLKMLIIFVDVTIARLSRMDSKRNEKYRSFFFFNQLFLKKKIRTFEDLKNI